ncbi:hypothetical protein EIP86_011177 [Pleurotus ostreatoroseus]|nr:hypothetical protein EIP86_011177 [Pleurotus ostreatoroseus]
MALGSQHGAAIVSSVLEHLSSPNVVSLGIRIHLDRAAWRHGFETWTKVESLFIEDFDTAYEFLAAFSAPLSHEANQESDTNSDTETDAGFAVIDTEKHNILAPRFLFPNLQELELFSVRWRKERGKEHEGDFVPHALTCLKCRMQRGLGLKQMKVVHAFNLTLEEESLFHDPTLLGQLKIKHFHGPR